MKTDRGKKIMKLAERIESFVVEGQKLAAEVKAVVEEEKKKKDKS